jgi:hypothetical protein
MPSRGRHPTANSADRSVLAAKSRDRKIGIDIILGSPLLRVPAGMRGKIIIGRATLTGAHLSRSVAQNQHIMAE